jgi:hypothetical protein
MLSRLLLVMGCSLAVGLGNGCGSSSTQEVNDGATGAVTLRLVVPEGHSFCDRCGGGVHIDILDGAGQTLETSIPSCSATCATCASTVCPAIACLPQALPVKIERTWTGTVANPSTCGSHVNCFEPATAPTGHYVARMCATPGDLTTADGGSAPRCTATGAKECVDVPFDLPGPSPVVGTLP